MYPESEKRSLLDPELILSTGSVSQAAESADLHPAGDLAELLRATLVMAGTWGDAVHTPSGFQGQERHFEIQLISEWSGVTLIK